MKRAHDDEPLPPIWARPEPPGRGPHAALSRSQIVQAALMVADREGLEAVSMRRLARELRAGAMSLYHYFQSREELLDLMGDTIAEELLLDELPADWREALRAIAIHSHEAFRRHPWLLMTLKERPRVSPNMLHHVEQSARAVAPLTARGVDRAALTAIVLAVDDYTVGYTLREQFAGSGLAVRFRAAAGDPYVRYLLESGEFPILGGAAATTAPPRLDNGFEDGLDWLLNGFAAAHGL